MAMSIHRVSALLRKLIPRLASTHDGEVVATARAIERTLCGAGADWHDLAAAIAVPGAGGPHLLDIAERLAGLNHLNGWETKFTRDMLRLLRAGARLTEKQEQALRRCYALHGE